MISCQRYHRCINIHNRPLFFRPGYRISLKLQHKYTIRIDRTAVCDTLRSAVRERYRHFADKWAETTRWHDQRLCGKSQVAVLCE